MAWSAHGRFRAVLALQGVLGFVFLSAGVGKLVLGPEGLVRLLNSLGLPPAGGGVPASRVLSVVEVLLGAWLVSGVRPRGSARAALGVLLVFTAALVYAGFHTGWRADCGCHFIMTSTSIRAAIVRNIALCGLVVVLLRVHRPRAARDGPGLVRWEPAGSAT